jgi:hypothetical protein
MIRHLLERHELLLRNAVTEKKEERNLAKERIKNRVSSNQEVGGRRTRTLRNERRSLGRRDNRCSSEWRCESDNQGERYYNVIKNMGTVHHSCRVLKGLGELQPRFQLRHVTGKEL